MKRKHTIMCLAVLFILVVSSSQLIFADAAASLSGDLPLGIDGAVWEAVQASPGRETTFVVRLRAEGGPETAIDAQFRLEKMLDILGEKGDLSVYHSYYGENIIKITGGVGVLRLLEDWPELASVSLYEPGETWELSAESLQDTAGLEATGQFSGKVTASNGTTALSGIRVTAYRLTDPTNWSNVGNVLTNASGNYTISGLAAGIYRARFEDPNGNYVTEFYNDKPTFSQATNFDVNDGATTPNINAALTQAGKISGTVTKAAGGGGASDVIASAHTYSGGDWVFFSNALTSSSGAYTIGRLPAGTYRVKFADSYFPKRYLDQWYNGVLTVEAAQNITVTAGVTTPNINAAMGSYGSIKGNVKAADGVTNLSGITVDVYRFDATSSSWEWFASDATDAAGNYEVFGLVTENYRVGFSDPLDRYFSQFYNNKSTLNTANNVAVTLGFATTGINAQLASKANISLVTRTNGQDAKTPPGPYILVGGTVNWTYVVTNTGTVSFSGITVTDNRIGSITCPKTSLAAGENMTCSASGVATAGQYANIGTVTGTPTGGTSVTASDPSHYFGVTININFVKRTNGEDAKTGTGPLIPVGGAVNWTYTVTSNSNVSLPFTVVDNPPIPINCPKNTLNPTDEVVCTASGTAVAGQYANTATLTVTTPGSLDNITRTDTSHYYGVITGINIEKLTNGFEADQAPGPLIKVGEVITWSYVITNTGNVDLTGVSVVDDQEGAITCPTTLALGATVTCTKMDTAEEGQYSNEATVTGNPPAGFEPVTDSDRSHYYGSDAGVSIKKLTNGVDTSVSPPPYIMMGDPVNWTYQVTNVGLYLITGIKVTDSDETLVISCPGTTLAPGAAMVCTASSTAKAGAYTNRGYVEGTPEGLEGIVGKVQNSDVSGYGGANPLINITKYINGEHYPTPPGLKIDIGEPLTFTYQVSNPETLYRFTNVVVTDDSGLVPVCPKTTLNPGENMTCSVNGEAVAGQQSHAGRVTAKVLVHASGVELGSIQNSSMSHYFGETETGFNLFLPLILR